MNFNEEVIETSRSKPVVVDFWAPWCGPCKFLGPIIEGLAKEAAGGWKLVKVNTDENQDVARNYGIQGIPAVKMFYDGEVIAEFTGALPKHQIERWLNQYLPDERKKELNIILKNMQEGNLMDSSALEDFVNKNPDFPEASVALARSLVLKQPKKAASLVSNIKPGNPLFTYAEDVLSIKELTNCKIEEDDNLGEKMKLAKMWIEEGNIENALDALIQAVMIDKGYCNELPRRSVIAIFNLLGNDHPLTKKYRKRFDMALY